jgi:hypothetical protein
MGQRTKMSAPSAQQTSQPSLKKVNANALRMPRVVRMTTSATAMSQLDRVLPKEKHFLKRNRANNAA